MLTNSVLRHLLPPAVCEAYKTATPLPVEEMPAGAELRRLRRAAGVSREVFAVCASTTVDTVMQLETGKTQTSMALTKSDTGRRLVAAFVALGSSSREVEA